MVPKIRTTYEPGSIVGSQIPPKPPGGPMAPRPRPDVPGMNRPGAITPEQRAERRAARRAKRQARWGGHDGFM
jgi:hypothetical protein